jgi:GNAT superfamily N-acetyltransferase
MINNISIIEIEEAVRAHWKLQLGSYFQSIHDLNGGVYNLGGHVTDYYWNYVGMINTKPSEVDILIQRVLQFAHDHSRESAFYIDPSTKPENITLNLTKAGFQPDDDEIWMLFNKFPSDLPSPSPTLKIKKVTSSQDMVLFVDIFHDSYEFLENGETSSPYGDSLFAAYKNPPKDVDIRHFIGYDSGSPVSISSIYISGLYAGLYNVGTPSAHRNLGYGTALSVHAIRQAQQNSEKKILLQTELGNNAERLYTKLGFNQAFSAAIWAREEA